MRPIRAVRAAGFAVATAFAALLAASASTAETVRIELNKLEPQDGACRAYLVFENGTARSFGAFRLDLILFNTEGVIARRLAVEGAPLPAKKTVVRLFDIQQLGCDGIGRILLNDMLGCQDAQGEVAGCTEMVEATSRTSANFSK